MLEKLCWTQSNWEQAPVDVKAWLEGLGLDRYAEKFDEYLVEFGLLTDLTNGDLQALGVALADRKAILAAIQCLSNGERRPVTILLFRLQRATRLSCEFPIDDTNALLNSSVMGAREIVSRRVV